MMMNVWILCAGEGELMPVRYVSSPFAVSCCSGWNLTDRWFWCSCLVVLFSCLFSVLVGWLVVCALFCGGGGVFLLFFHRSFPFLVFARSHQSMCLKDLGSDLQWQTKLAQRRGSHVSKSVSEGVSSTADWRIPYE